MEWIAVAHQCGVALPAILKQKLEYAITFAEREERRLGKSTMVKDMLPNMGGETVKNLKDDVSASTADTAPNHLVGQRRTKQEHTQEEVRRKKVHGPHRAISIGTIDQVHGQATATPVPIRDPKGNTRATPKEKGTTQEKAKVATGPIGNTMDTNTGRRSGGNNRTTSWKRAIEKSEGSVVLTQPDFCTMPFWHTI